MRKPLRSAAVAICLLLAMTGCALSNDEKTAADSLAATLGDDESPKATKEIADCVADKWVGEVGTDALEQDELITTGFEARPRIVRAARAGAHPVSKKVAQGYADAWLSCVDFDAISLDQKKFHTNASGKDLDGYADCLKDIDDDLWRRSIVATWTADTTSSSLDALRRESENCESDLAQAAS